MEQDVAGGQKAHNQTGRGVASLEKDLEDVSAAVSGLLAAARAIDPARDEHGHARSRAYDDAIALLKVSAKLGHSIAAMSGSKFEHNINVRRDPPAAVESSPVHEEEDSPFMWLDADTLWDWQNKRTYVLDPTRNAFGRPRRDGGAGGNPLPISGGSNGNSGNSDPGKPDGGQSSGPRIRSL